MFWFIFLFFSCQMFYYGDEEVQELEVTQVSSGYNIGITKAISSSLKIHAFNNELGHSHGSGNLFYVGNHLFVLTASHVVDNADNILLEETNGNMLAAKVIYESTQKDIAILLPYGEFTEAKPTGYVRNKSRDILAKKLHYYGYPENLDGFLATGFVSQSDYSKILMQSYAWMGCSGSVVFDSAGRTVGIVHAILILAEPVTGLPSAIESVVVVNRVYDLERNFIRERLVDAKAKDRNSD
ncbi:MAG: hypothetical protein GOVbin1807_22 [Prokaryotic dsDNA virus sp.]|nr:MAG: hypothetical protein GOVbin1807_22 [Prokaryotic dsDNA virus sp.]|tara:strand:- start:3032 stop:3751 length:720 start_codon:yes stop_codon:yes gene_type:complete